MQRQDRLRCNQHRPSSPTRSPRRPVYYVQSLLVILTMEKRPQRPSNPRQCSAPWGHHRTPRIRRPPLTRVLIESVFRVAETRIPSRSKLVRILQGGNRYDHHELHSENDYRNTGTFLVSMSPRLLLISHIHKSPLLQEPKSQRSVTVTVMGNKVPLYGSGASLSSSTGTTAHPVSLKLSFVVRSRAYVLGKLVKPKFNKKIECDITYDPKKPNAPISIKKSCTYDS
ncbi:putative BOI-related E3 ubiquitin-protein ligase 2-like [Hibiscus syriacus]|uniref:BOI-related E3 ubiquitin-protein ligase 2-like n=1 Tax=Hibiscus syriacus TaxID=106335 RepID=A0A6A2XT18_HIBSY|nr:putative BOI-related E3 ubiquitin-protein ligase 2-like [Hibiscus syriacus]